VWDLESGQTLRMPERHAGEVHVVPITPDGRPGVSASWDHTLRVRDLESGRTVRTIEEEFPYGVMFPDCMAITPDGRYAVADGRDRLIVWDLESGQELYTLADDDMRAVYSVAVTTDAASSPAATSRKKDHCGSGT
jgi:WD40 repeat protein